MTVNIIVQKFYLPRRLFYFNTKTTTKILEKSDQSKDIEHGSTTLRMSLISPVIH